MLSWALAGAAAEPELAHFAALPETSMMVLSPTGNWLAFRSTTAESDNLVVYDLKAQETVAVQPLGKTDVEPTGLQFASDDFLVIALRQTVWSRGLLSAFEASIPQYIDLEDLSVRRLVDRSQYYYQSQTGMGRIVGRGDAADTILTPVWHAHRDRRDGDLRGRLDLFAIDLATPRSDLLYEGDDFTVDWMGHPTKSFAIRHDHDPFDDLHRLWLQGKEELIQLYEQVGASGDLRILGYADEGKTLLLGRGVRFRVDTVIAVNIETLETSTLLESTLISAVLRTRNDIVLGFELAEFSPRYWFPDDRLTDRVARIQRQFDATSVALVSWSDDLGKLLFLAEGTTTAGSYYLHDASANQLTLIADQRPAVKAAQIADTAHVTYPAGDGTPLPMTVFTPSGDDDTRDNGIVVLLNGPPLKFAARQFDWEAHSIAAAGYVVIKPEVRGAGWSTSNAMDLKASPWMRTIQSDVDAAVEFAEASGLGREDDACVVGVNFGGYAALMVGAHSERQYRCVVSVNGISDLTALRDLYGPHGGSSSPYEFSEAVNTGMGQDSLPIKLTDSMSPVRYASGFDSRVLMIYSTPNSKIPEPQSTRMHKALKRMGKDSSIVKIRKSDFWFSDASARLKLLEAIHGFLAED